jgi:hydroxyethylthiazole kinase-like uncharacterized protein yjeF
MENKRSKYLAPIAPTSHKYSRGIVGVIAGSNEYPGAAVLTTGGALRGGAGYIKYFNQSQSATDLVLARFPEVVPVDKNSELTADAWVVGPGLPSLKVIPFSPFLVLDSAAISLAKTITGDSIVVITPHEGEASELGYDTQDRNESAQSMARDFHAYVILKGARTLIASPSGELVLDKDGGAELSTAGTGDILAGLTASLLASWQPAGEPQIMEVLGYALKLHAAAGKQAAKTYGAVTASDVLKALTRLDQDF